MKKLMQIHLNFICRSGRSNQKGESPIVLRIIYRHERRDIYTGLYCCYTDWDNEKGKLNSQQKRSTTLNENLEHIRYKAMEAFDELKYSGNPFTIGDLIRKIKGQEERPVLIVEFLKSRNQEIKERVYIDITPATYEKYERILRFVLEFLSSEFRMKNYPLANIDIRFLERYFQYLRVVRKIGNNTAVKYLGAFRTLLMPALREGIIRKNPFREVKFKSNKIYKGYLTEEEIKLLSSAPLKSRDLERIRDQFLFCCYTGLSYIDLQQLTKSNIRKDNDGSFFIEKPRQKTGQQSIIPLIGQAVSILLKHSSTSEFRDFNWYVSSNQKMNKRLKEIGQISGIDKMLHMHLARHTFATTITLSNGVPIESVSAMLGHATIRQTQDYAKVITGKLKSDMARINKLYAD